MTVTIDFYTRPACSLCDVAWDVLIPVADEEGAIVRKVNIDEDDALRTRFGSLIPVVAIDGNVLFTYRVDADQARQHIRRARLRRPTPDKSST